jgi:hypothetical protein
VIDWEEVAVNIMVGVAATAVVIVFVALVIRWVYGAVKFIFGL